MTDRLNVLIVEDDKKECDALIAEISANADKLCLVGALKSSDAALAFIRSHKPHAVILDLELQEGMGDGLDLLDKLRSTALCPKPYIILNTNSTSKVAAKRAKKMGADYAFAKWQSGYTIEMVVNHLLLVMPEILGCDEEALATLTEDQLENKMRGFVQDKFDKLGVSSKNDGYNYLVDAVILAAKGESGNWARIIGERIGKKADAVFNAMKYAIEKTWNSSDIPTLQTNYTAPIPKGQTEPTVVQFVSHFKQKLIDYLNR